uniref:Uncharacterized protein n=1 Tax=Heterorhabditis bacteriophora TaxID=37862 RepID=A0A1I7XH51_HETBA
MINSEGHERKCERSKKFIEETRREVIRMLDKLMTPQWLSDRPPRTGVSGSTCVACQMTSGVVPAGTDSRKFIWTIEQKA